MGREAGAEGHRNPRTAQRALERPLEVSMAGEAKPTALGVPQSKPLDGRDWWRRRAVRATSRSTRETPGGATGIGSLTTPVGPIWICVPIWSHTPQSKHGVHRQSSTSTSSRASCQSSHSHSRVQPGVEVIPGQHLGLVRSRVVNQSTSTGLPQPEPAPPPSSSGRRRSARSIRRSAPRHARPARSRSRPDGHRATAIPRRCRACRRGTACRSPFRIRGPAESRHAACANRASVVSWSSWAAHWKGVCGLGTNPPIDTVQRISRRPRHLPAGLDHLARRARRSGARRHRSRSANRT